jgi:hypothetical protein
MLQIKQSQYLPVVAALLLCSASSELAGLALSSQPASQERQLATLFSIGKANDEVGELSGSFFDLDRTEVGTVVTECDYDEYGNLVTLNEATGDGRTKSVSNQFDNDPSRWLLGRLRLTEVKAVRTGLPVTRRVVSNTTQRPR